MGREGIAHQHRVSESMKRQGKTKIVCTIGPATNSVDCLVQMIDAGMDVVRLNFSHGTQEEHRRAIENVHQTMKRTGAHLTILQDLQGPKIRVGELDRPSLDLHAGETLSVTTDPIVGVPGKISTTYRGLAQDVQRGDRMLLDDGKIEIKLSKDILDDKILTEWAEPTFRVNIIHYRRRVNRIISTEKIFNSKFFYFPNKF